MVHQNRKIHSRINITHRKVFRKRRMHTLKEADPWIRTQPVCVLSFVVCLTGRKFWFC